MGDLIDALADVLPAESLVVDPDIIEGYRADRADMVRPGHPVAVVRAGSTAEVCAVLRVASAFGVPVVTRGAGTGLSGGSAAIDGCITLSMERMRRIEIDPAAMVAVVEPGLLNVEVKQAARAHGLWYPPDPSSFEICSIGGNLATNAGGLCCVKYGVTTDYVLGMEVVLADGRAVRLGGRTIKDVAGYDLKRLFVGSEGTLGVITSATLRLTAAAAPRDHDHGGDVRRHRRCRSGRDGDRRADQARRPRADGPGLDPGRRGADPDGARHRLCRSAARAVRGAGVGRDGDHGGGVRGRGCDVCRVHDDEDEGEQFMAARRMAIPAVEALGTVLIEDVGVPIPRHPRRCVAAVGEIAARHDTLIAVIGHAGDGNFHPLVTFDRSDAAAVDRAEVAFGAVMEAALALGGTITGEHGIGTLKRRWLGPQVGADVMEISARIKAALDPLGILNPGKVL